MLFPKKNPTRYGIFNPQGKSSKFFKLKQLQISMAALGEESQVNSRFYNNQVFKLCNDKQSKSQLSYYQNYLHSYGRLMDGHFQTIKPQSLWLAIWNCINFAIIFISFIETLFVMFIMSLLQGHRPEAQTSFQTLNYGIGFILMFDMILVRARISISQKGKLITSHSQLLHHYITHYLLYDLLSLIALLINQINIAELSYIRFIFYFKLATFKRISNQIYVKVSGNPLLKYSFGFFKITFFSIFFTFVYGSIYVTIDLYFYFQGGYYEQNGFLWLTSSPRLAYVNLYNEFDWYVWFEYGLYMVMQMVRGCGYGDLSPRNPPSQLFYNIASLTMTVLFFYYTSKFIAIWLRLFEEDDNILEEYSNFLENVNTKQIKQSNVTLSLKDFGKIIKNKNKILFQQLIGSSLSKKLLYQFNAAYKQHFVLRLTFLTQIIRINNDQQRIISEIAQIIKTSRLYKNQKLLKFNQKSDQRLYFSSNTSFMISIQEMGYSELLPAYSLIGQHQFFIDQKSCFDVKTFDVGVVQFIQKESLLNIFRQERQIFQLFFHLYESIRLGQVSLKIIELSCWHCGGDHLFKFCPVVIDRNNDHLMSEPKDETDQTDDDVIVLKNKRKHFNRADNVSKKVKEIVIPETIFENVCKSKSYCIFYNIQS